MEPDTATLAELKQQCKTWGWDFDETLAEWKQQNSKPAAAPKPEPKKPTTLKRPRPDFEDIVQEPKQDHYDVYQQLTKPSFSEAKWEHVEIKGWNHTLVKNLALELFTKYKQFTKPIGFIGDTATGKTLFCELFAIEYKFNLIPIQETDPIELKEWLDLSVNPSLLDTQPRLWLIEHWDAYTDTKCGTILKKYFTKMIKTGIVICTAWTGFDTREIETWYKFTIPNKTQALMKGAKKINIELSTIVSDRLLEYAGGDLSAALSALQYFKGAPPTIIAKSMPPPNLRVLLNTSLVDRSQHIMRLLGESDDLALTYLFHEIVPEAQCLASECLTIDTRGNHNHDMWMCTGNLENTWKAIDTVSFCDAAAGYDAKIFKQFLTGPLHSTLPIIHGRTLTPLQIPLAQILWKQNQPNMKEKQKKTADFFKYTISKDHVMSTFTKGREKKEEEAALDYYESRVCDSKALPGASVLLWSRDLTDPRQAPDLRDRTMDLIGWTEKKHKVRVNGKWVEKSVWE